MIRIGRGALRRPVTHATLARLFSLVLALGATGMPTGRALPRPTTQASSTSSMTTVMGWSRAKSSCV